MGRCYIFLYKRAHIVDVELTALPLNLDAFFLLWRGLRRKYRLNTVDMLVTLHLFEELLGSVYGIWKFFSGFSVSFFGKSA